MLPRAATITFIALLSATVVQAWAGEGSGQRTEAAFRVTGWTYGIDPALLRAIAEVESSGQAGAASSKGALGLMQLLPETAVRFGITDPFDPVESAIGAAKFLSYLRDGELSDPRIGDHLPQLLAAYNAGEGAVHRYAGVPPYQETQEYVRRVLWLYLTGVIPRAPVHVANRDGSSAVAPHAALSHGSGDLAILYQLAQLRRERAEITNARRQ